MAIALVGAPVTAFAAGAAGTIAAPAAAHTTGSLIVVNVGWETAGVTVTSVTDTAGNVYIPSGPVRTSSAVAMAGQQWHCLAAVGNATNVVTATFSSAAPTFRSIHVAEWSHVGLIALDTVDWANGGAANTTLSMTVRPTALATGSNLIYLASHSFAPTAHTNTVGGLTNGAETANEMQQWYLVQTGAAALPLTFTYASDNTIFQWSVYREIASPIITQHPSSTPRQVGDALHLDVLATPSSGALIYQWQDNSGGSLANMSGETKQYLDVAALTIAMHARQYRVLVTDSLGTTTSNTFVLAVSDRADAGYWLRDVPSDSNPTDVRLHERPDVSAGGIVAVAADTVAFSDSAEAITTRVAAATDTLTVSDSATAITDRVAVATDTITFSDSAVAGAVLPAVATDSVTFSDSAVAGASLPAVATDTVTFSDSAVAVTTVVATASDSITLSDSAEALTTRVAVAVDSVTLTDSAVAILVPPGGAAAVAEDSITFSDSAVAVLVPGTPVPPVNDGGHDWRRRTEGLMRTVRAAAADGVQFSDSAEAGVITALSLSSYLMAREVIAAAQDGCLFGDEARAMAQRWDGTLVRTRQAQLIRSPIELVD